jgi:signal transduction histidine kinase
MMAEKPTYEEQEQRVRELEKEVVKYKEKEMELALRNSEKKLTQAVEGNSIPTFIIDNNHFITHWNKACESLTGISAAEIVGTRKAWSAFYAEERQLLADLIVHEATEKEIAGYYEGKYNKSILTEGAYECEDFFPAMGENGKWLFFTASPLKNSQGTLIGAIETFQDITGRRSVEGQLRQSHKMEAIGTLAGGVAHDFNNLLTVIIGNAQLALMDAGKNGLLYEEIKEIKKAGERAVSVTRQLLAFSRKQIIKPEILDINEEINETGKMLQRLIREDIEFLTVLEPELWKVYADPMQINQVLMNMVVNARDAMPGGGKLTIETANMELDNIYFQDRGVESALSGSYVMLAVTDNGTGMDEKTRFRVFDPFFTTKEKVGGTGMGLSTVYGIVKQNNGYVWVYSEPGKGTSFKVYFPKVAEDVTAGKEQAKVSDEISGSETVLIVEDNDALRKLAKNALRKYGYEILEAENGEKALNVSETHEGPVHLLLTDVVMPRMSGTDLSEKLQSIRPETRVIYMSGYTADAIVRNGILRQNINFIEKPFSLESLGKKVRQVLDNIK